MESNGEPNLTDLLGNLADALDEYRAVVSKGFGILSERIDGCEQDTAALRDNVNESVTALGNRVENLTRGIGFQEPQHRRPA